VRGFRSLKNNRKYILIIPGGDPTRLCIAHTCNKSLALPIYQSKTELIEKLLLSIHEGITFEIK
jgi:hypothetical protein